MALTRWREEARRLPPPDQAEHENWADGIVYHMSVDGVLLRFDPERRWWMPAETSAHRFEL